MDEALRLESERLARSWMQHDPAMLRDYLVADVEDPRLNVQSVLSRHFLLAALYGGKFQELMDQELRFAIAMNWLLRLAKESGGIDEFPAVLHALKRGADNAEGIEIPRFVVKMFAALPATANGLSVPNYLETFLATGSLGNSQAQESAPGLETFQKLWQEALRDETPEKISVLEPACGSANDYRFLEAYGLARFIDYCGFDLCEKNVANARAQFPQARFAVGNVFEIDASEQAYDFCFVHDLFEHLSPVGMAAAVKEICRVTRQGICAGFFSMDEIPETLIRPVGEYHWNTLSMEQTQALFIRHAFAAQVFHIGSFLKRRFGCDQTHNENAYTFVLFRQRQPSLAQR